MYYTANGLACWDLILLEEREKSKLTEDIAFATECLIFIHSFIYAIFSCNF